MFGLKVSNVNKKALILNYFTDMLHKYTRKDEPHRHKEFKRVGERGDTLHGLIPDALCAEARAYDTLECTLRSATQHQLNDI